MNWILKSAAAGAVLFASIVSSNAATVQFDNRATFEAASGALTTEGFNSFGADVDLAGSAVVDLGAFTVTGPASGFARIDANGTGSQSVNGTGFIQGIGAAGSSITFLFDSAITAFGVDLFGINNVSERTQVLVGGDLFSLPVVNLPLASFFGLTSTTAFTSVSFSLLIGEDAGLDNVSFGGAVSVVPLPAALPLFGTGLVVMGFLGWRKKRKVA